jgi:hypothetical protein
MKKVLKVGLCTLLVGAAALVVKDSVNNEKSNLEMNVQKEFISQDSAYSLRVDPKDYGLVLGNHTINQACLYEDEYLSKIGWMKIGAVQQSGDLKNLYNAYSELYLRPLLDGAKKRNLGVQIARNKYPMNLIVDNNPAFQGKTDIITYKDGTPRLITSEVVLRMTLSRDERNVYLFTLCYMKGDPLKEVQANRFYDDVLESFHALKYVSPRTLITFNE